MFKSFSDKYTLGTTLMSEEQRRITDTRSDVRIKKEKKWRNEQIQKKLDKLPFVVLTSDIDDPSYLNLARKTVRGRKKKDLEGNWNDVENTKNSTTTLNNPGKRH